MTTTATFSSRPAGITDSHVARYALIYLRQSSLSQVEHNVGSTARQYKAKDLAQEWGWPEDRIIVVDDDLGTSSTQAGKRRGFAHVLDLINRGQVGALFTVHADRLARNLLEFAQIVTLCEKHFVPLVIDGELKDLHETHDRLLTILLGVFVPIYIHTHNGLRTIDSRYVELAQTVGLSQWDFVRRVVLPGALPGFLLGLRFAVTGAWLSLVVVEQINSTSGIGYMMELARTYGQTDIIIVGLVVYGVLGLLSDAVVRLVQRRALSWRRTLAS